MPDIKPDIRGLIFDLDNTLFHYGPRYRDYYALTAATAAIRLGLQRDLPDLVASLRRSGAADDADVAHFAQTHGLPEKALVHAFNSVAGEMFPALSVDPDYAEILPDLPDLLAQVTLPKAVMTHGPRAWAEPVIDHIRLRDAFPRAMLFPIDHANIMGRRSRAGFLHVAGKLGIAPENIAVLDDVADNFLISASLGMHSVLVHWGRAMADPPPHVHEQVADVRVFLRRLIAAKIP